MKGAFPCRAFPVQWRCPFDSNPSKLGHPTLIVPQRPLCDILTELVRIYKIAFLIAFSNLANFCAITRITLEIFATRYTSSKTYHSALSSHLHKLKCFLSAQLFYCRHCWQVLYLVVMSLSTFPKMSCVCNFSQTIRGHFTRCRWQRQLICLLVEPSPTQRGHSRPWTRGHPPMTHWPHSTILIWAGNPTELAYFYICSS